MSLLGRTLVTWPSAKSHLDLKPKGVLADVEAMKRTQLTLGRLLVGALDLRRAASRQQGQALIEYALIISLIAVVAIGALSATGVNIKGLLNRIAGEV